MFADTVQILNRTLHESSEIIVNNISYKEIYNFQYEITNKEDRITLLEYDIKPNHNDDKVERNKIIKYFQNQVKSSKFELSTRQLVYTPEYENVPGLNACLSLLQLVYRDNKLDLHVHVRSQHFDNNFMYDNQTYCMLIVTIAHILRVEVGNIYIKIISLHR